MAVNHSYGYSYGYIYSYSYIYRLINPVSRLADVAAGWQFGCGSAGADGRSADLDAPPVAFSAFDFLLSGICIYCFIFSSPSLLVLWSLLSLVLLRPLFLVLSSTQRMADPSTLTQLCPHYVVFTHVDLFCFCISSCLVLSCLISSSSPVGSLTPTASSLIALSSFSLFH